MLSLVFQVTVIPMITGTFGHILWGQLYNIPLHFLQALHPFFNGWLKFFTF